MTIFLYFQLNTLNSFAQSAGSGSKRSSTDTSEAVYENKRAKMFKDDNYLFAYLEKDIQNSRKEILEGKGLSQKGAMAMLLKGLYNHITHLEEKMVTKDEFNSLVSEFRVLKNQFDFLKWLITFGFVFLAALKIILTFVKK